MRTALITLGALTAALMMVSFLAGCSSKGSSTSCGSYRSMSTSDKITTITNLLKDHGESNPSPAKVDLTRASVTAYCFMHSGTDNVAMVYKG